MYFANACWLFLAVITTALILCMAIHFMLEGYEYKKYGFRLWRTSRDKLLSIIIFILSIAFGVHSIINSSYALISESRGTFEPLWCFSSFSQLGWYSTSKMFLYTFYIVRLHIVFNNSSFAVPLTRLKALAIFIVIPIMVNAAYYYFNTIYIGIHFNDIAVEPSALTTFKDCIMFAQSPVVLSTANKYFMFIGIASYLLSELIYSIIILRLFLSRVLLLSLSFASMKTKVKSRTASLSTNKSQSTHYVDSEPQSPSNKDAAQRMESKNNELFLNLAIKTTNLIILVICTNYVVLIKFGLQTTATLLMIDALCNCFSVYASYSFSSKYYDLIFGLCHTNCYGFCAGLCYCCCLRSQIVTEMELDDCVHTDNDKTDDVYKETLSDSDPEIASKISQFDAVDIV